MNEKQAKELMVFLYICLNNEKESFAVIGKRLYEMHINSSDESRQTMNEVFKVISGGWKLDTVIEIAKRA